MDAIRIRPAARADASELRRWRNDPASVAASVSDAPVSATEHEAWFARVLADPARILLIGEVEGRPVGTCRFDLEDDGTAEVSINMAPEHRGRGLARILLEAGIADLLTRGPRPLTATIRLGNEASVRLFTAAGFVEARRDTAFAYFVRSASSNGRSNAAPRIVE